MSHDFKPEPHEKAMIDVMLKGNTTPKWIYDFNKFLIEERTTGEIIKFIDELLHQELQKARHDWRMANVEPVAKAIYDQMSYTEDGVKPEWVERGNSFKQDEARRLALRALDQSELDQPIS